MIRYLLTSVLALVGLLAQAQDVFFLSNGATVIIETGAVVKVQGGLQAASGSTILNNGSIYINNNSTSNQSNWTDNNSSGVFTGGGTGMVYFQNPNGSSITGNTVFPSVTIDAVSGTTISNNISISNNLLLKNGKLNTSSFQAIVLNNAANAVQADASNTNYTNSWVNGSLRRGVTANTGIYDFPVGNATQANLLQFVNNNITGPTLFTASFGIKPGTDAGLLVSEGQPYTSVNAGGVWYLTPDVAATAGSYDIKLYFNGFTGLADNNFGILRRIDASSNASDWQVPAGSLLPTAGAAGRIVSSGYARRNNISSFSQFGIGMSQSALPITLVEFNAKRTTEQTVLLNWKTAWEQNNKGFEIERRLSNENLFSKIGLVASLAPGGSSSTALNYSYTDFNNFGEESYYRLRQVDLDNKFAYSQIVKVNLLKSNHAQLYPNPADIYTLLVFSKLSKKTVATIFALNGQLVKTIEIADGQNQQLINVASLPKGEYTIRITNDETAETLKLIKQ